MELLDLNYSNPGTKTIEADLFQAMIQSGAISKDNSDDMKKVCIPLIVGHDQ